jgi:hypothetical protein
MLKEPVETSLTPRTLTDNELIRFAEEAVHSNVLGMTRAFQEELLRRFIQRIN